MVQHTIHKEDSDTNTTPTKITKLHLINGYIVDTNMTKQQYEQHLIKYKKHNTIYFNSIKLYFNTPKGDYPHYTNLTINTDHIVCINEEYKN